MSLGCPCGWEHVWGVNHARRHREWELGIRLREGCAARSPFTDLAGMPTGGDWRLWRARPFDPLPGRRYARRLREMLWREAGYDVAPWPSPGFMRTQLSPTETMYAALAGDRLVGFVVVDRRAGCVPWDGVTRQLESRGGETRLAVLFAWTAARMRRQGIASGLVRVVAGLYGVDPRDVAYMAPLTPAGKALAFSVRGERNYWLCWD